MDDSVKLGGVLEIGILLQIGIMRESNMGRYGEGGKPALTNHHLENAM